METKICYKCKDCKTLDQFSFKDKSKNLYNSMCKACHNIYAKAHHQRNHKKYLMRTRNRNIRIRDENVKYVYEYLKQHPCIDCGETNPIKLEFDHRNGSDKVSNVSNLIRRNGLKSLQAEIAKCDVRCSNCHKVKTAKDQNWGMYKLFLEDERKNLTSK